MSDSLMDNSILRDREHGIDVPPIPLWKVNEVARFLNINKQTLRNWKRDGKLNFVKVGRSVRIPREEVIRIVGDIINNEEIIL